MKRKIIFSTLIIVLFLSSLSFGEIKVISREGKGALIEVEGEKVLLLAGDPYQMGYQHGVLLRDEVKQTVDRALAIAFASHPGWLEEAWEKSKGFIPPRYLEEMRGLSEGSGVPLRKIQLANVLPEVFHCSGAALFGRATKGGEFFHVRILDYMTEANFQKTAVVMVLKPSSYNAFITAGFAGFLGSVTGMNDKRVTIGEMGGKGFGKWKGVPMSFLLRKALEEANSLEEAVKIFKDSPRTCEYYYVISEVKKKKAIAIRATPEEFQTLKPGENSPLLPLPLLPDTLIISGENRYRLFRERVKENYGNIDLETLKEIIKRPVSMESNLHNAIFLPRNLEMYLAVAADTSRPNYQACYQKYVKFNLKELLAYFPREDNYSSAAENSPPSRRETGIIPSSRIDDFSSANYSQFQNLLKVYQVSPRDIPYKLSFRSQHPDFYFYSLEFPSLVSLNLPEDDKVRGEYIQSRITSQNRGNKKPAVVILDISVGDLLIPRLIAYTLASRGINSLIITLPFQMERKPASLDSKIFLQNPSLVSQAIVQAVNDVRVGVSWLRTREENDPSRIGICGVSLGGMIASLAAGVMGDFPKATFILAGGDLVKLVSKYQNSQVFREVMEKLGGERGEKIIRFLLQPYDPLTYSQRLTETEVLMINAWNDEIIPRECTLALYNSLPQARILWYPGGHYQLQPRTKEILEFVGEFFSAW